MLPQKFPFAFLDREAGKSGVPVLLTAGSWLGRGRELAQSLALEILAQAALVQLLGPSENSVGAGGKPRGQPAIAGFDDVQYSDAWALRPPIPGEQLRASTRLLGRFGPMLKVSARLTREGETLAEATLLLVVPRDQ